MKKILFFLVLVISGSAQAQSFEGTVKWTIKSDITDPATKAKMDAAKAKASTPENMAKMKEMQDKMNDPQMKALMNSNPQMKAQMEAAMRMAAGGDMTAMMPKGLTIRIKGDNSISKMDGGPMASEVLTLADKNASYMIDRDAKTYSALPAGSSQTSQNSGAKVTKTTETIKILGYNCVKYLVEVSEHGRIINESIWTTTEIKNFDFKKFSKAKMGRGQSLFFEGMDGVPMRIEMKEPTATMTMEVTEIKAESLPAADFTIPADFRETPGMFGR